MAEHVPPSDPSGTQEKSAAPTAPGQPVIQPPGPTARVVLPQPNGDADTDEETGDPQEEDDGDILADFPDETDDLELVHARIGSLTNLRLPRFANHLKRLCLRQNRISVLNSEDFHPLTQLEELDLYDNKIKHVGEAFDKLADLTSLDLSFNLLRSIPECLEKLQQLEMVYFVQNKITKISGLHASVSLRSLELGGNRLRTIEGLDALVNLEELWLGKNKISKLEGLDNLQKLKILSIQSNRITKMEGLDKVVGLEQLYLSHNGIKQIEGLENNINLTTLDVGANFVAAIENVGHLTMLEELWLNGNQIPDLKALDTQLHHIETLRTIYLEANPCQTSDMAGYRRKVMLALPQVTQIDATYANPFVLKESDC
ncbi:hypothetical protein AX16_002425 [Volvariella volvacea WC 439]|nr:hypothetical protein AX16_002425 [Volvariella volvacea WC 439]